MKTIRDKLKFEFGDEILIKIYDLSDEEEDEDSDVLDIDEYVLDLNYESLDDFPDKNFIKVMDADSDKLCEESDVHGDAFVYELDKKQYRFYMIEDEEKEERSMTLEEQVKYLTERYETIPETINNILKLHNFAVEKCPDLKKIRIDVCDMIERKRQKGRKSTRRYFCHTFHIDNMICCSKDLFKLSLNQLFGILLHEYGHIGAGFIPEKMSVIHNESQADLFVLYTFGVELKYTGDLELQTVPDSFVIEIVSRELK